MSTVDKVFEEINQCRTNPAKYAQKLSKILRFFRGNIYEKPGYEAIETEEGPGNVLACINFLKSISPVTPLQYSVPLALAAQIHADDIGSSGKMSHIGEDGSEPCDRIERFCQWSGHLGENIDYGNSNPEDIIVSLLIDDGVPARGQRLNILKKEHKYVGVGFGYHSEYQYVCVLVFAELVIEATSINTPSISSVRKMKKSEYVKVKEITEEQSKLAEEKKVKEKKKLLKDLKSSLNFNFKDLTDDEVIEIKEFFNKLDISSSGTISVTEIKQAIDQGNIEKTNMSVLQMLAGIDPGTIASLNFEGLLSLMVEAKKSPLKSPPVHNRQEGLNNDMILEMKQIFDLIDESHSELITKQEIQKVLQSKKLKNYNSTILDLMNCIDDEKAELSFENFVEVISNIKESSIMLSKIANSGEAAQCKKIIPRNLVNSYESYSVKKVAQAKNPKLFNTKKYERHGVNEEQVLEIKKAFDLFDYEKKGQISTQDIKLAMKNQGFKRKNPTVYQIVCELGDEIRGEMDFDDFFNLLTERNVESVEDEEIKKFFDMFDREGLGYIEIKNLKTVARELGESLEDDDIVDLIRKSDLDGDGKVTYADFFKIMTNAY